MHERRRKDLFWNGPLRTSILLAVIVILAMPTAGAAGGRNLDAPAGETFRVTPEEGSDLLSFQVRVPLEGSGVPLSHNSTCSGVGTDSCVGRTWDAHCCSVEFEQMVPLGTVGRTTNTVTVLSGVDPGAQLEAHCDWYAAIGLCTLHEHGSVFIGDTIQHTGEATIDLCVLCQWEVSVDNT